VHVKVFLGLQQQIGLRAEAFPLPDDVFFFFPFVGDRGGVTAEGVAGPFRVYFLDRNFRELYTVVMRPGQALPRVPHGTSHLVESSLTAQRDTADWFFLERYAQA
jgi:hypothetical protein